MWGEIAKSLIDLFNSILNNKISIKEEQRKKIGSKLFQIHELLNSTADDLEHNIYPHGKCDALKIISSELCELLEPHFNIETVNEIHEIMLYASNVESEFARRGEPQTLIALRKASGSFLGLSISYKF
jgi:hypothetical protein